MIKYNNKLLLSVDLILIFSFASAYPDSNIMFYIGLADAHEDIACEYIYIGETDRNKYIWHGPRRCKSYLASVRPMRK
jgi:hypothetical protein